jgi:sphingolipid delta-4 desaturase
MASASSTYSLRTRGRSRHAIDKTPLTPSDTDHSLSSYAASDSGSIGKEEEGPGKGAEGKEVEFVDPFPDFLWMTTEEPHRSRRMAILKAHPEVSRCLWILLSETSVGGADLGQVRKLMGPTPLTFPLVLLVLSTQLCLSYLLRHSRPFSPLFLLTAYALGGTLNQNTFLAIHEITHNLAFRSIRANKFLAIIANFAIGVPYAMAFKGYHIEHHKFLGEDGIDTDLPSRLEAVILNNVAGKTFFA